MSDPLKEACKAHLEGLGCTVWGQFFDIKSEDRLDEAAEWFAKQMRGVLKVRQAQEEEPLPEYKGEDEDLSGPAPRFERPRYFNREKVPA